MKVSKKYQGYKFDETKAFEKNGKLYVTAEIPCSRCGGKGVIITRVENGIPILTPVDGGICYHCEGRKTLRKDIRLYTEEEYAKKEAYAETARKRQEAVRQAEIKAQYADKYAQWLEKTGFNVDEETYIYFPTDSYNVKDELKKAGFRFHPVLLWHAPQPIEGYEDKVIKVKREQVAETTAFGTGFFFNDAKSKVQSLIKEALPPIESEWQGEIGQRLRTIPATLTNIYTFEGMYGQSQVVTFEDNNKNIYKWFTSSNLSKYKVNEQILLSGTVKNHVEDNYLNDAHVTMLIRCKLEKPNT